MQADRGPGEAAKATLRDLAGELAATPLRVRTLVVLGDLLASDGDHAVARPVLREAVAPAESLAEADDLADYEVNRARDVVERLA
ncbi:hypothetical protein [Streptomyces albipurpureus]|uniref:HEAT repeat domain-containing protein n=1 Tax=Streptomyces albipurpureus TaxID=2897419 RepID=A0ABT0V1P4_9ACTN|nr:hypothetical protein [Streptomyces sp. CWNU-1]MCM2394119.1 hypothetical protein [Streptomyces sp. CWNU-1]